MWGDPASVRVYGRLRLTIPLSKVIAAVVIVVTTPVVVAIAFVIAIPIVVAIAIPVPGLFSAPPFLVIAIVVPRLSEPQRLPESGDPNITTAVRGPIPIDPVIIRAGAGRHVAGHRHRGVSLRSVATDSDPDRKPRLREHRSTRQKR